MSRGIAAKASAFGQLTLPGLRPGGLGRRMVPSLVDQGLTSVQSLVISVVLIKLTGPAIFGQFVYVFTLVMVAASLQNGLIGVPALVHVASRCGEARRASLSTLLALDRWYRAASAGTIAAATAAVSLDPVVIVAAGCFGYAHLSRETARNVLFATGAGHRAPVLSAISFAVFAPVFAVLLWSGFPLAAPFLAASLGIASALAVVRITDGREGAGRPSLRAVPATYRAEFPGLGWRLLQCGSNEVQTRSHVFVIAALRGVDQVGVLEAGRVLWSPIVVMYQTWQKVAQPRMAELVEAGQDGAARRLCVLSIAGLVAAAALYAGILMSLWAPLSHALFSSFSDVRPFVIGWLAYTVVLLANWILIALLNAQLRFRTIALAGLLSAASTALLLLGMVPPVPLVGAIGILVAVQGALLAALVVFALMKPNRRRNVGVRP